MSEFWHGFLFFVGFIFSIALMGGCLVGCVLIGMTKPIYLVIAIPMALAICAGWVAFFADWAI